MRGGSRWMAALAACFAAILVPACESGSSTTPPGASTTCRASQLGAARLGTAAAAGHIVVTYGLQNTSTGACTLFGYPGVQMVDRAGRALATQVSHGGSYTFVGETPAAVALAPGVQASFFLGYSDVPAGNRTGCAPSSRIDITPPGDTAAVMVADQIAPCGGAVTVSPVHAGTAPPP